MVNKLIKLITCLWLGSMTVMQAAGAEVSHRTVANFFFSDDTDNTTMQLSSLGYEYLFSNEQFLGVHVGVQNFHGEDATVKNNDFNEVSLVGRKNLSTNTYLQAKLTRLDGKIWTPSLHTLLLASTPVKHWLVEFSTDKNMIETASALARHLIVNTYSASAEYIISKQHTVHATIYQQDITDNNKRHGVTLQYKYKPAWFNHGYFKLRGKQRSADFDAAEYFSPADFSQYHLLVGYEKNLNEAQNLHLLAEAGIGQQYINHVGEDAYEYRLGVRGWIKRHNFLDTYYACTTDGGLNNYRYCSARLVYHYLW